jgi:hypothetical protein
MGFISKQGQGFFTILLQLPRVSTEAVFTGVLWLQC